ncbi:MAG: MFS transporter [Rhodanobacteraceae bacterium]
MEAENNSPAPESAPAIAAVELGRWFRRDVEQPLEQLVGGPRRLKVIALLACVLALDAADKATVGAVAAQLEHDLHIGNVEVGLLVTVSTAIGAIATLPFGVLVDRVNRRRLLVAGIGIWSIAMAASGASVDYTMLLLTRLGLGAVVAVASPAIASLIGDFFHPGERGRIYGYILAGELLGVAFGFLISGNVAAVVSWRVPFFILAGLGAVLAVVIARKLPEPKRGGQGRMPPRNEDGEEVEDDTHPVTEIVGERGMQPRHDLVLTQDPEKMPLWHAVRYVLSIPTYRVLIIASALGYFYFTGLRTFAIVYMRGHFDLQQAAASTVTVGVGLGAIAGVLFAGWVADRLIGHGELRGRIIAGAVAYIVATLGLLGGLFAPSLIFAAPFFFVAAAGLGGANPAVDSARLDIMHSRLWGRAEGVRSTLLYACQAAAPLLFGWVSGFFGGHNASFGRPGAGSHAGGGLEMAFLIMLVTLAAAGFVMLRAMKTYPRDVATAIASEQRTAHE